MILFHIFCIVWLIYDEFAGYPILSPFLLLFPQGVIAGFVCCEVCAGLKYPAGQAEK